MPKAISVSNGSLLVNLDRYGLVRDLYFPQVGLENHLGPDCVHRIGAFADGQLSWLNDGTWDIKIGTQDESMASAIVAINRRLEVQLTFNDLCYNEKNVFMRKVVVKNLSNRERELVVFFAQQFEISLSNVAHTAYYDPRVQAIIHYRNHRAFLMNAQLEGKPFDGWTTGVFNSEGKDGSHRDAEDGKLSCNPIEHGHADSVLSLSGCYKPTEEKFLYYWLVAGLSIEEAQGVNAIVLEKGPGHLTRTTNDFWKAWVNRQNFSFYGLDDRQVRLFKQSLFYVRAHADKKGGIIASTDAEMLQGGKDSYAYIWPRDSAFAALALTRAGDTLVARKFFEFCNEIITADGYFMHKYSPDGSLGSSWHGWMRDGKLALPIQEDETAIVLWALHQYYEITKDLEFIEEIYNTLIKPAADFLTVYRDQKTGLPQASFDLWEEKYGIHTYTAASVYGALKAAANFGQLLGKVKSSHRWITAATEIREAIMKNLWDGPSGLFYKMITVKDDKIVPDATIDSSTAFGLQYFGVLEADDDKLKVMWQKVEQTLLVHGAVSGMARYAGDNYYRRDSRAASNPWFITTLWFTQWLLERAQSEKDLEIVRGWLSWTADHATDSGVLSEQLDSRTGELLSAAPLTWSQAEYVTTVIKYLDKLEKLNICKACNPVY